MMEKQAVLVREAGVTGGMATVSVPAAPGMAGTVILPDAGEVTRPRVPMIRKPPEVRKDGRAALFIAALREEVEAKRAGQ